MSSHYAAFIRANRELWSQIAAGRRDMGLLLVEPEKHPMISHSNCVFARVIGQARGLRIGWIDTGDPEAQERLQSYDAGSQTISLARRARCKKTMVAARAFVTAARQMLRSGNILDFALEGVRFGDIVYDCYLARFHVATIPKVNRGVLGTLWIVINNYYSFKRLIEAHDAAAVLVSHEVGLSSGVLMRTALQLGRCVYHRRSGVQLNLKTSLSEVYVNADRPRDQDIATLSSFGRERLDREFAELLEKRMRYAADADAERAYAREKRVYRSKEELTAEFGVAPSKPLVFVMLHAFNDHPHSHFGRMLFRDYYEWFTETLRFARNKTDVCWIFKEHPSAIHYPTHDISLPAHFTHCPPHIVFLETNAAFSSESLLYVADAVVTVAGTAGVEFSAAAGVPSIMAGGTWYTGFGFTIEPRTRSEYFDVLAEVERVRRLTGSQQDMARKVFLYSQRYSSVPFSWLPEFGYEAERDPALDTYYWDAIPRLYAEQRERLVGEFWEYVEQVRDPGFSRLARLC